MILCDASECAAVQTISSCFIPPSLLPAFLVCGIWHSDFTSVQSLWAPLSIFSLSLVSYRIAWSPPPSGFLCHVQTGPARCWYSPGLQPFPSISSLWHRWTQEGPTLTNACENFIPSSPFLFIFVVPCVLRSVVAPAPCLSHPFCSAASDSVRSMPRSLRGTASTSQGVSNNHVALEF